MSVVKPVRTLILTLCTISLGYLALAATRGDLRAQVESHHVVQKDRRVELKTDLQFGPPKFPISVATDNRHLVDATGTPFLLVGDAAWSLIAQLKREDVEIYLQDRRARGFNAILVNLIEHRFASNAPANAYHAAPFLAPGAFDKPNEAYFAHADWVIERASELGFVVLLAPCYTGAGGGSEGWYQEMVASGAEKLRAYGRFVGERYSRFNNIIWVENGDSNPSNRDLVRAVANGIYESDPNALQTAHNATGTAGADLWEGEAWFKLNNVYTYGPVFPDARTQYLRTPTMPFVLLESQYENGPDITPQRLRRQAYQALLTGATGQIFGNSPIWYFDGTGEYSAPAGWKKALDSPGARSMTRLRELFTGLHLQDLVPDVDDQLLVGGVKSGHERAVAATSSDHRTTIVYFPEDRQITLRMAELAGTQVRAVWWDPVDSLAFEASESPFRAGVNATFRPSAKNGGGDGDWILILSEEE